MQLLRINSNLQRVDPNRYTLISTAKRGAQSQPSVSMVRVHAPKRSGGVLQSAHHQPPGAAAHETKLTKNINENILLSPVVVQSVFTANLTRSLPDQRPPAAHLNADRPASRHTGKVEETIMKRSIKTTFELQHQIETENGTRSRKSNQCRPHDERIKKTTHMNKPVSHCREPSRIQKMGRRLNCNSINMKTIARPPRRTTSMQSASYATSNNDIKPIVHPCLQGIYRWSMRDKISYSSTWVKKHVTAKAPRIYQILGAWRWWQSGERVKYRTPDKNRRGYPQKKDSSGSQSEIKTRTPNHQTIH